MRFFPGLYGCVPSPERPIGDRPGHQIAPVLTAQAAFFRSPAPCRFPACKSRCRSNSPRHSRRGSSSPVHGCRARGSLRQPIITHERSETYKQFRIESRITHITFSSYVKKMIDFLRKQRYIICGVLYILKRENMFLCPSEHNSIVRRGIFFEVSHRSEPRSKGVSCQQEK